MYCNYCQADGIALRKNKISEAFVYLRRINNVIANNNIGNKNQTNFYS